MKAGQALYYRLGKDATIYRDSSLISGKEILTQSRQMRRSPPLDHGLGPFKHPAYCKRNYLWAGEMVCKFLTLGVASCR